jgi:D-lyxose ketol-isomerase
MADETNGFETINLIDLGRSLPVDSDHTLRSYERGHLLLINLKPQEYRPETHKGAETIIAITGQFSLLTADSTIAVRTGESITVPPNIEHRFSPDSDAVILVLFE